MHATPATTTAPFADVLGADSFGPASFASVTVATIASGGVSADPAGVARPPAPPRDHTAGREL